MSYDDGRQACTAVEAEFRAMTSVCTSLVEGLGQLLRWKDDLLASSAEVPAKSLVSLTLLSSNLHRSQTQLPMALKGLRKAIKHVVKLADPEEASSRRAQRNWGIIVMALHRKVQMMGSVWGNIGGKKKKGKKKRSGLSRNASYHTLTPGETPNRTPRVSHSKRTPRVSASEHTRTPRVSASEHKRTPRVSFGEHAAIAKSPKQSLLSPKVTGDTSLQKPASPARSPRAAPSPISGSPAGTIDGTVAAVPQPPPVPSGRFPRQCAELPPPPDDLPGQEGLILSRAGFHRDVHARGGGEALPGERRVSGRFAAGQNVGAPARARFEEYGGGRFGHVEGIEGAGGRRAAGPGARGRLGFPMGVDGTASFHSGGGEGGGEEGARAVVPPDERHFELPPLGRLPSRESRGLGVGMMPAGYRNVEMPRMQGTSIVDDASVPALFEFSAGREAEYGHL